MAVSWAETTITELERRPRQRTALGLSLLAGLIAFATLLGYLAGGPQLVVVINGQQSMSPIAAVLCQLLAAANVAEMLNRSRLRVTCAGVAAVISAATLILHLGAGQDVLSRVLLDAFRSTSESQTSHATALGCLLLAIASLGRPRHVLPRIMTVAVLIIAGLALLGYAYGVEALYALPPFSTFSLRTAVCLFLLASALLTCIPQLGLLSLITAPGLTGRATRQQLSFLVVVPLLGYGLLRFADAGLIGFAMLMVILSIGIFGPRTRDLELEAISH